MRALVVATIVAAIAVLSSPALGSADTHVRYVALGDSRAAGPYLDAAARLDGCARSNLGYPGVVAQILHPESFTNVSCTGARTEHLTSVPQQTSTGPVPPQLDALRPDTTLVTVSVGGNDIAWPKLVSACYTSAPFVDAHCRTDPAVASRMDTALGALGPKVTATLGVIGQRAPNARVLLVGHGGIFGTRGCWPNIPTSDADAAFVNGFFTRMNRVLAGSAAGAGANSSMSQSEREARRMRLARQQLLRGAVSAVAGEAVASHRGRYATHGPASGGGAAGGLTDSGAHYASPYP